MRRGFTKKSVTLMELLISIVLMTVVILSLTSVEFFSHFHVINSERRAKLQNEASYILNHMNKNVVQSIGDFSNSAIVGWLVNGFRVRIDTNQTPGNYSDDIWRGYARSNNILFYCNDINPANWQCRNATETFTSQLLNNGTGFVLSIIENGTGVDVTLRLRWNTNPAVSVSPDNPEVVLNSRLYSRCASSN